MTAKHRFGRVHRLRSASFARVVRSEYRVSLDAELGHARDEHAPSSLYVEAVK
jgi:hypothetical protein